MIKDRSDKDGARDRSPSKLAKPLWEMNKLELQAVTSEFDRELVGEGFGSPNKKQQAQLARARRKRGRPKTGLGSRTISVTIEKGLLAQADRLAKKLKVSRAALIAKGLRSLVCAEVSR